MQRGGEGLGLDARHVHRCGEQPRGVLGRRLRHLLRVSWQREHRVLLFEGEPHNVRSDAAGGPQHRDPHICPCSYLLNKPCARAAQFGGGVHKTARGSRAAGAGTENEKLRDYRDSEGTWDSCWDATKTTHFPISDFRFK